MHYRVHHRHTGKDITWRTVYNSPFLQAGKQLKVLQNAFASSCAYIEHISIQLIGMLADVPSRRSYLQQTAVRQQGRLGTSPDLKGDKGGPAYIQRKSFSASLSNHLCCGPFHAWKSPGHASRTGPGGNNFLAYNMAEATTSRLHVQSLVCGSAHKAACT